jgi:hypothetical protein
LPTLRKIGARGRRLNGKQFDARPKSEPRQGAALIINATKRHKKLKGKFHLRFLCLFVFGLLGDFGSGNAQPHSNSS